MTAITKCAMIAQCINELRLIPRATLLGYLYFTYEMGVWYMALPDPSGTQMAFATLIAGLFPAVIGLYGGAIKIGANAK